MHDLTVCITSFKRSGYLRRTLDSCYQAGIKHIVVFSMEPDADIHYVCSFDGLRHDFIPIDLGCHESWLQAAYRSKTERLIILHDDDMLAPEFGEVYRNQIKPILDRKEAGFASWRGHVKSDDGKIRACEYFVGQSGVYPTSTLREVVSRKGRLSLSPVISIFNRGILIHALKESTGMLQYLRPGMELGTEIVAYMRHCDAFKHWLHIHKVLSYYGSHEGSGTVKAETSGTIKPLTDGYDSARNYCNKVSPPKHYAPRYLLTSWPGLQNERIANARKTWDYHFNMGTMLDFPVPSPKTPRLHEMMDYAFSMAMPEDVLVYANLDLAFTVDLPERIMACLRKSRGICIGWRRTMEFNPDQQFKSVRQGLLDGGVDMVAMTPQWWDNHRKRIPDMFVASNFWDFVLRVYCERVTDSKCYLDDGTYHFPHESYLDRVKLSTDEQKWNHKKAKEFFGAIGQQNVVNMLEKQANA